MRLDFSKKDNLIFSSLAILFLVSVLGMHFLFIKPLNDELKGKKMSLENEQKLLALLQEKQNGSNEDSIKSTTALQYKMPVKPLAEQMILDFEKAEVVSGSSILSMSIAKDGMIATTVEEDLPADGAQGITPTEQPTASPESPEVTPAEIPADTGTAATAEAAVKPVSVLTVPEGVKKLTVQLSVESPGYEELEKFISTLETLKRIVVVESIDYTGGEEITSLQQEEEPITFKITVSAFYMPELVNLQKHLPQIESPEPANKRNPLSQFSDPDTDQDQVEN